MLRGRCACKTVTYEVSDEFVTAFNCHCSRCRAMTGSAFLPWGEIEPEKLKVTKGEDPQRAAPIAWAGDSLRLDAACLRTVRSGVIRAHSRLYGGHDRVTMRISHGCEAHAFPRRNRVYCDDCLPHYQREQYEKAFRGSGLAAIQDKKAADADPTHGLEAAARRAETNITRKRQARESDEKHATLVDLSAFQRDVLRLIRDVPLSRLRQATGLSLRYVSLIRRGERTPHPRHWQAFIEASALRDLDARHT